MDRVFESGAVGSAPSAPASPSSGYPTAGDPSTATPATKPGPYWFHQVTEELRAVIVGAGLTPSHTNLTQLRDAINALIGAGTGLGSSGIVLLNATATLTNSAHVGKTVLFDSAATGAFTVTLPLANTVATGRRIQFQNLSSFNVTVQRQGSNVIYPNGASVNSIVVRPGDTLVVEAYNGVSWFAVDGVSILDKSESFFSAVKTLFSATDSAPVFACRAWVNFNGTGTVAIRASGNISSITDNGAGDYYVNLMTALQDNNYSTLCMQNNYSHTSGSKTIIVGSALQADQTASSVRIYSGQVSTGSIGLAADSESIRISIFR